MSNISIKHFIESRRYVHFDLIWAFHKIRLDQYNYRTCYLYLKYLELIIITLITMPRYKDLISILFIKPMSKVFPVPVPIPFVTLWKIPWTQ